ncbi:PLP-dependent aminotransferase family protein [Parapusillimonas sp. SGNA-6]|nr:PLP-dependent aminotransferase family protein [Parapusillimonas sp. SGNA-6]
MAKTLHTLELADLDGPLHERLANAIADAIEEGRFQDDGRLPTHRELSRMAAVSIGTVTKAIDLLSARGVVRGEVGRGTFIIGTPSTTRSGVVDLSLNIPPPVIPESAMVAASERAARRALAIPAGGLYDLKGTQEQRGVLSQWLARSRVDLSPDALVLCVGAQQAIHLSFSDLRTRSTLIASESETFSGAIAAAANLGMEWLPIPHDDEGMLPDKLDKALAASGCKIIYAIPVCHNPLGFEVGLNRRQAILKVAQKHDAYIVEDDIYGIYAAKHAPTYKELDPARVYYLTSLSKCLTPLLRVGVLAPPEERLNGICRELRAQVFGAAPVSLELACALIDLGADREAAEALVKEAKLRTEIAKEILRLAHVPMPTGAPHLWLPMHATEAERLARRAAEQGIRVTPPDAGSIGPEKSSGLRLSILAPTTRYDMEGALRQLLRLMDDPEEIVV